MTGPHARLNYHYMLERSLDLAGIADPQVLDFGCGTGTLLTVADEQNFSGTLWGTDSFAGHYEKELNQVPESHRNRIRRIVENRLPFDDETFDVVVSNQVFEHVFQPKVMLAEINRVLKPGGAFLTLFPTLDAWFEGHLGIYFVHWMKSWPRTQHAYCRLNRVLGLGYNYPKLSSGPWATRSQAYLRDACAYHHVFDVRRWWKDAFGSEPESYADDYMVWRIARDPRLTRTNMLLKGPVGRALLRFICHKRAGRVFLVRKPEAQ